MERQLQCQADKGLLEYNQDRLFDRYYNKFKDRKASHIKWKNRERNSQQLILNLQAQILLLQNNIPQNHNNNRTGMVGYELKKFNGYPKLPQEAQKKVAAHDLIVTPFSILASEKLCDFCVFL